MYRVSERQAFIESQRRRHRRVGLPERLGRWNRAEGDVQLREAISEGRVGSGERRILFDRPLEPLDRPPEVVRGQSVVTGPQVALIRLKIVGAMCDERRV